jgi:hypothetical protein
LEKNELFSTFKTLICRSITFKSNSILQENNVLDAAASNIDGFLWRDTCVSSTKLNSLIGSNRAYLHFQYYDLLEVFLSKINSILKGDNVLDAPAFNTYGFLYRDTCVSSI